MPQDAFHIRRIVAELQNLLVHGRINRITQANKDELTFTVYTGNSTAKLALSTNASGARVCLSSTEKEPAPVAPNFCMLLRKHLQNAEIIEIRQHEFERIVEIVLHCANDFSERDRILHCELMGKYSNLVLTENGRILGALKTTALENGSHRVLLAGAEYRYPAPQDKITIFDGAGMRSTLESYLAAHEECLHEEGVAECLFASVAGLALPTAREIVRRAVEKNGSLRACFSERATAPLYAFVEAFCMQEPCKPHLRTENGTYTDFFAFPVENGIPMPSLNKAEDEFFTAREGKKHFEDKRRRLENAVRGLRKKQAKKLQELTERVLAAEQAEAYRIKGELLTANLYRIERGATSVTLENWYSESGETLKIALDATLPPAQNAQRYFKTYNKLKRAKEIALPMRQKAEEELAYTESVLSAVKTADCLLDLKELEAELTGMGLLRAPKARVGGKKKEEPIPFREYVCDGMKILVGRNNVQNDRLVKSAAPDDVWLHAQKYHSAHVIIVTEGRQVRDETIKYAAELCAYYSDGRDGDKIPVDYCRRKYVKKPKGGKAGFVTYTDYKTALVHPQTH